ncbi:MAG: type II toxin-antitoxin system RelE/ParE family toxin [Rhizobiaceae bacterium]
MTRFLLTPAAQADFNYIWDYRAEHWSTDQADPCTDDIHDACRDLAAGRKHGRTATVRAVYLKDSVGAHVLFYRVEATTFGIVRILHGRMDADKHLS